MNWQWKPNQTVYRIKYVRVQHRYYGRYRVLVILGVIFGVIIIIGAIASAL